MKKVGSIYILLFTFKTVYGNKVLTECRPVNLLIVVDGTSNDGTEKFKFRMDIAIQMENNLQPNSNVTVVAVDASRSEQIILSPKKGGFKTVLTDTYMGEASTISTQAILKHIDKYFQKSKSKYTAAEILVLITGSEIIVSDDTDLERIRKKKGIVAYSDAGKSSYIWNQMAANTSHIFYLSESSEMVMVQKIIELMCADSVLVCDTDGYTLPNYYTCRSCDGVCASTIQTNCNGDCPCRKCPHFYPVRRPNNMSIVAEETGKYGFIAATISVLVTVVAASVLLVIWKKKLLCFKEPGYPTQEQQQHEEPETNESEDEREDDTGSDERLLPANENVDVEGAANEDEGEDDTRSDGSENAGSADDVIADDRPSGPRGKEAHVSYMVSVITENEQVFAIPMHDLNAGE